MQWPEGARQAARRLVDGNRRFVREFEASVAPEERSKALSTADPFAVVLCCSDSRVPPEIVLDQGLGLLFVVRVAGNVAGSAEVASVEYAVARWGCPLVVVLGHTGCGAVAAALDPPPPEAAVGSELGGLPHLASLLVEIRSNMALGETPSGAAPLDPDPWRAGVEANVRRSAGSLGRESGLLQRRLSDGTLAIVPAIYDLETGLMRLLDLADYDLAADASAAETTTPPA